VLVVVLVLVIDSRAVSKKRIRRLSSFTFASSDPLLTVSGSKPDNEDDDEYPRKPGAFLGAT